MQAIAAKCTSMRTSVVGRTRVNSAVQSFKILKLIGCLDLKP